ncbi:hypothetical protein SCP_0115080 [Sparassis crispa]|uniref:Uncharacterized protein n=1 Tax=Sparassis crispa TaxID=139825 RepID=A0A401G900_9APHY|nr:hypothetical protein SCP_0115080 [Sparassis crispa]GBE78619.1 hypothetical protein SCP_0115080 [Sparassis crispa]
MLTEHHLREPATLILVNPRIFHGPKVRETRACSMRKFRIAECSLKSLVQEKHEGRVQYCILVIVTILLGSRESRSAATGNGERMNSNRLRYTK